MGTRAATRAAEAAQRRQKRLWRRLRRLLAAVLALIVVGAGAWTWQQTRPRALIPVGEPLPDFTLVDDRGQPLTRASLHGRAVVFGFAFLHDAQHAPGQLAATRALADAVRAAGLADRVALVTLTAAPDEDSPDHLRAAAAAVGAAPPWSIASGEPLAVAALLDALDVDWRRLGRERAAYGSPIFADDRLLLVDGKGRPRGEYDARSWTARRRLRAELERVAAER